MESIISFFVNFPHFLDDLFLYIGSYVVYLKLMLQIEFYQLAYSLGSDVANNLGLVKLINSAFSSLPASMSGMLNAFGFAEGLTIIGNSVVTAYILRFVGL